MPTGQLAPLGMDAATGGVFPPGMILDDDFLQNRITSYVAFPGLGLAVDLSTAVVANGVLTRSGVANSYVQFRNQRPWSTGRTMVKINPSNVASPYVMNNWAKIIDLQNALVCQAYNAAAVPGALEVYKIVGGAATRLDAGNINAPTTGGAAGISWWYVTRVMPIVNSAGAITSTQFSVQSYQTPPNVLSTPTTTAAFSVDAIFSTPGYGGLGLGSSPAGANTWSFGEWTIVDDTNRMVF
jgi:hypothetical protein